MDSIPFHSIRGKEILEKMISKENGENGEIGEIGENGEIGEIGENNEVLKDPHEETRGQVESSFGDTVQYWMKQCTEKMIHCIDMYYSARKETK